MRWPITNTLVKIFAKGFYKEHSGFLLFLFVVIFSHLFWMKPLGGHLNPEESLYHHFIILISFANSPVIMILVFALWLVYSAKSWNYVKKKLKAFEQQFIFYSITSLSRFSQFQCWFIVQAVILFPAVMLGAAAAVAGVAYNYYMIPIIILLYLLFLTSIGAIAYVWCVNVHLNPEAESRGLKLISNWKKPYFSLFIYHIIDKMKLGYLITKILSGASIAGGLFYFYDFKNDPRIAAIVFLMVSVCHSFVIYQIQRFEDEYLMFSRNLPFSRTTVLRNFAVVYLILILPEIAWIGYRYPVLQSLQLTGFLLSTGLVFRSLACRYRNRLSTFVMYVFGLFILYFIVIMFGFAWSIILLNLPLALLFIYKSYYIRLLT